MNTISNLYLAEIIYRVTKLSSYRSSHQRPSIKKMFLEISQDSQSCQSLVFNKAAGLV